MSQPLESPEIAVNISHQLGINTGDGVSTAELTWPEGRPLDTYTISLGAFVSIELDKHLAIRPNTVKVYDAGAEEAEESLEMYLGSQMVNALRAAPTQGMLALKFRLDPDSRLAIASLQLSNPSTPELLRRLCRDLVGEHTRLPQRDRDRLVS